MEIQPYRIATSDTAMKRRTRGDRSLSLHRHRASEPSTDDGYHQVRQNPYVERHATPPHIHQQHRSDLFAFIGDLVGKRIVPQ